MFMTYYKMKSSVYSVIAKQNLCFIHYLSSADVKYDIVNRPLHVDSSDYINMRLLFLLHVLIDYLMKKVYCNFNMLRDAARYPAGFWSDNYD